MAVRNYELRSGLANYLILGRRQDRALTMTDGPAGAASVISSLSSPYTWRHNPVQTKSTTLKYQHALRMTRRAEAKRADDVGKLLP
jgi:hypothetical protein